MNQVSENKEENPLDVEEIFKEAGQQVAVIAYRILKERLDKMSDVEKPALTKILMHPKFQPHLAAILADMQFENKVLGKATGYYNDKHDVEDSDRIKKVDMVQYKQDVLEALGAGKKDKSGILAALKNNKEIIKPKFNSIIGSMVRDNLIVASKSDPKSKRKDVYSKVAGK